MIVRLLFCLFFIPSWVAGQDHLSNIQEIQTLKQAEMYADAHADVNIAFMHDRMQNKPYQTRKDSIRIGDSYVADMYRIYVAAEGKKKLYRFRLISLTDAKQNNRAGVMADSLVEELKSGASFKEVFLAHTENIVDSTSYGDVGWVDLDYFIASFQEDLRDKHKGAVFASHDTERGWHNVVEMTHEPELVEGHYVLFFPELSFVHSGVDVDHALRIEKLKSAEEMLAYANKHAADGVSLILFNERGNPEMFEAITQAKKETKRKKPVVIEDEQLSYRWIKDTTVELFSFQYIFIDGSKYDKEEKNKMLNDIYARHQSGTDFSVLAEEYWGNKANQSRLEGIEGSLLMSEVTEKLKTTNVGQIFVARTSQSYFIGVPLREPEKVAAFLAIQYYSSR